MRHRGNLRTFRKSDVALGVWSVHGRLPSISDCSHLKGQLVRCSRFPIPPLAFLLLLGATGCTDRSTGEPGATGSAAAPAEPAAQKAEGGAEEVWLIRDPRPSLPPGRERASPGEKWSTVVGEPDRENQYLSTVRVFPQARETGEADTMCSGVLVSPRLVLTAGNCVCRKQVAPAGSEAKVLIDSKDCVATATIETVIYDPPAPEGGRGWQAQRYEGVVRPHRALKILLDAQDSVLASEADLATILLAVPVKGDFPAPELARVEPRVGEALIMVGFGYDEVKGTLGGYRRVREHVVTKISSSGGRILYEQPKHLIYRGDSGGPCLRKTPGGASLAGILSRSLGREASFTSTYLYRDWLQEEIRNAASAGMTPPPAP